MISNEKMSLVLLFLSVTVFPLSTAYEIIQADFDTMTGNSIIANANTIITDFNATKVAGYQTNSEGIRISLFRFVKLLK